MSVYALLGLVVVAFALFMAFQRRKRPVSGPGNNWKNSSHLGTASAGVAAPGEFSATQDGGAAAYGEGND